MKSVHEDINKLNQTLLSICRQGYKNLEEIKDLIEKGADVNTTTSEGYTPLMLAIKMNNLDVAKILIESGADLNSDRKTFTSMHFAARKSFCDAMILLIENGADVNLKDGVGYKPFDYLRKVETKILYDQERKNYYLLKSIDQLPIDFDINFLNILEFYKVRTDISTVEPESKKQKNINNYVWWVGREENIPTKMLKTLMDIAKDDKDKKIISQMIEIRNEMRKRSIDINYQTTCNRLKDMCPTIIGVQSNSTFFKIPNLLLLQRDKAIQENENNGQVKIANQI